MSFFSSFQKISLGIALPAIGFFGFSETARAASLTPDTIASTWSSLAEVKYNLQPGPGCGISYCYVDRWAADNTQLKVPYNVLTNMPRRIGQSSATDTENYGAIVSDFTSTGDFNFSGSVFMPNDSDVVGFLWGFQDPDNHYRLSWDASGRVKRTGLTDGPYERPDLVGGVNPPQPGSRGVSLVKEVNGVSTFLATDILVPWQPSTTYNYNISRTGSDLLVSLLEGQQTLFSTVVSDSTFMSGKIGFNTSGVEVLYGNTEFSNAVVPGPIDTIPEPGMLLGLLGLSLGLGTGFGQKRVD